MVGSCGDPRLVSCNRKVDVGLRAEKSPPDQINLDCLVDGFVKVMCVLDLWID